MALSLRARLTAWYSAVVLIVLAVVAVTLSTVHARLGIARIDDLLAGDLTSATGVFRNEIGERLVVPDAAQDALSELEIPGSGIAIVGRGGRVFASRSSGAPDLSSLVSSISTESPVTLQTAGGPVRARAVDITVSGEVVRVVTWTSLKPFARERATVGYTLAITISVALLVAATGGWLSGRQALRPLALMAHQADHIDTRRLDERLDIPNAADELGILGGAFNRVLDRLSAALTAQRQFMADASHQLRTPISVARTAAQVTLAREERPAAEYRESLELIAEQTRRLTRMVEDMFMLALADCEAQPLQPEDFYLNEVVEDCVAAARVLGDARHVSIAAHATDDVQFKGDETLIRQMILNLLENAIRYTPSGETVSVGIARSEGSVRIDVSNPGPGIPGDDRERIFERFVRLDPAGSSGAGGLGLPIARWIAEAHGGTLQLDTEATGGTRFVALLPLKS